MPASRIKIGSSYVLMQLKSGYPKIIQKCFQICKGVIDKKEKNDIK